MPRRRDTAAAVVGCWLLLGGGADAQSGTRGRDQPWPGAGWTETECVRVRRSALPETRRRVELHAARGEGESFQILLRAGIGVAGIDMVAGDLRGPGGAVIEGSDAVLYRQHQFEITEASWGVTDFTPGWYPDALIPFRHPITGATLGAGAELVAVPFDLPAHQTHGFLVDVRVPDAAPAGVYRGMYRITARGVNVARIPVELTVFDFAIPEVPTLKTSFWAPEHQMRHLAWLKGEQHPEGWWQSFANQGNELVARHRINGTLKAYTIWFDTSYLAPDGSFTLPVGYRTAVQTYLNAQPVNAVELPFKGCPTLKEVAFGSAGYDENAFLPADFPPAARDRLVNYVASWDAEVDRWTGTDDVLFYVYLCDEPNSAAAYAFVQALGGAIRGAGLEHVEVLVVEQTTPDSAAWGDLYGAVDTWVPYFTSFNATNAAARRAAGESIWTYTALTTWGGGMSWQTDLPLVNHRIPTWVAWRHEMEGLLYWSMAYWWQPGFPDLWEEPRTYTNVWMGTEYHYHGDGVLVYPAEKGGYEGIAPSLRLKAIRDGLEDYEYLAILEAMGKRPQAEAIVIPLANSFTSFSVDPAAYEAARVALGELIEP